MTRPRRPTEPPLLLTMTEAARSLRVHVTTVRAMIRRGDVPVVRFGRSVRVYAPALATAAHCVATGNADQLDVSSKQPTQLRFTREAVDELDFHPNRQPAGRRCAEAVILGDSRVPDQGGDVLSRRHESGPRASAMPVRTLAQPNCLAARGVLVTPPARALQRRHDMLLTSWVFTLIAAAWLVAFVLVVGFLWLATRGDSAAQGNSRLARKPNTLR
jgi:excisionase family DNA binding protein